LSCFFRETTVLTFYKITIVITHIDAIKDIIKIIMGITDITDITD
jgi:hypothetical protein